MPIKTFCQTCNAKCLLNDIGYNINETSDYSDTTENEMKDIQYQISNNDTNTVDVYIVFDENDNIITHCQNAYVGDIFIDKGFNEYEVYYVDETLHIAKAKYIATSEKPKITKKLISEINKVDFNKQIGFYCTHNDESYIIGDGTESVYGKGGIHDIAKLIASELSKKGVNTVFDDTLHIPHDSYAYTRSSSTAKGLISDYDLDAIFDIHRDGASRKTYVSNYGGEERCKVRIVVGQANPNKEQNLEFAKYLISVSEVICPWLFLDIYYAKGHYNQALTSKSLLFEMGSHLTEKELVEKTVPYLAEVIDTALYNTVINEDGELIIGTPKTSDTTLNNYFDENENNIDNNEKSNSKLGSFLVATILLLSVIIAIVYLIKKNQKKLEMY